MLILIAGTFNIIAGIVADAKYLTDRLIFGDLRAANDQHDVDGETDTSDGKT